MTCTNCKTKVLEKFSNEDYSEYLKNKKRAERQGIELGWFCYACADKMCMMCRNGIVAKYIPAKEEGEIKKRYLPARSVLISLENTWEILTKLILKFWNLFLM